MEPAEELPPAVNPTLDPMLVEVAIQAPPQTVAPLQNQDMGTWPPSWSTILAMSSRS